MIFDLHCDTVWKMDEADRKGEVISLQKNDLQIDEEKLKKGGYFAQCFAIYIPNKYENPYQRCLHAIALYKREMEKSKTLLPVYRYADFAKNKQKKKISSVLTMEDGCPIEKDFGKLKSLYDLGVRMICLTHNYPNAIGYPNKREIPLNPTPVPNIPDTTNGLTDFGKSLILEMNRLGIIVDTSHLSDKGFYDAIEISRKPIVASHSNARGLCGHIRNLTDDMLYKLADNGGVLGLNYAKQFLHNTLKFGEKTINCVIAHANYVKSKIGVDHLALGSDFDGIDRDIELKDASCLSSLIKAMSENGFSEDEIEKITYKNALRVFKATIA